MAAGAMALLLRVISWWEAAVIAGAALAFTLVTLPRVGGRLHRSERGARRFVSGVTLYPATIVLLLLTFSDRLDILAGAWGILAFGYGMATVVGRRVDSPTWRWNRERSIAGTGAFIVCGGAAGSFLCWWCRPVVVPPPYLWFSIGAPLVAAASAAAVETVPMRLDRNLSVAATAAAVLWWMSLVSSDLTAEASTVALSALPIAIAANMIVAAAGYFARTISLAGTIAGGIIGVVILITTGWAGWYLLLCTFAAAVLVPRLGLRRKTLPGIAEPHGGRRGAANAIANTGIATAAAMLSVLSYASTPARVAFVAALAAGGSDTIASEIGKAWGRRTYLLPTFRRVAPGTSGAISLEGTSAGLLGALGLGILGVATGLVPLAALGPVIAGATLGSFAESLMGATLEGPGIVNNDVLNFLNTAIAAATAILLAQGI
jgi:uncharacterized protein (TIGR00297 family)